MRSPTINITLNRLLYHGSCFGLFYPTLAYETIHSKRENNNGLCGVYTAPRWLLEGESYYVSRTHKLLKN